MKHYKRFTALSIVVITGIFISVFAFAVYRSDNALALRAKRYAKTIIAKATQQRIGNEKKGLTDITQELKLGDGKKIYIADGTKRFINYAEGYYFDTPPEFELTNSTPYMKAECATGSVTVSREWAFEKDVDGYIAHYLNRFILNGDFQKANNITVTENTGNDSPLVITAVVNDLDTTDLDTYTYAFFRTKTRYFYRLMFKYNSGDADFKEQIDKTLKTFKHFSPSGVIAEEKGFAPTLTDEWSDETKVLYNRICNGDKPAWGIFVKDIYNEGIENTVPDLEKSLDFEFPVILSYMHFGADFPLEFMRKCYNDKKLVELTYQITSSNNENLFGCTPFIDIYRGKRDGEIRRLAKAAKEFGHPFLFRLNNEVNSDWTSYSGVVNLSDPEIFIENWKRFYRIFKEEGVNNAIWIFNPNDRNYPPCNWNDFTAYYPGNEYVHMIGVTGYNNGTHYKDEKWREFDVIYDAIAQSYLPMFEKFPWIITEFSSSSIGGDKASWIKDMFAVMHKYPQIKIAVWFSYADFEVLTEGEAIVSRPYWLDETDETLAAFKAGLKNYGSYSLFDH